MVQYDLGLTSPYVVSPATLILGTFAGGFIRREWLRGKILVLFILLLLATAISLPIYANASAAVGGLLIALVGLGALDLRAAMQPDHSLSESPRPALTEDHVLLQASVLALILCVGVLLALDAQAAIALTVPLAIVVVLAVWTQTGPPQWLTVVLGTLVAIGAVLIVVFLGSRPAWPSWLASSDSLSSARHTLWSDALSLWGTSPLFGSGPGSFTPSSELASSSTTLAAVHSLPLQVGSELGAVGAVLLGLLFVGGLAFAARGNRAVAFIAMTAWTALAIHSSIDHLEDFPIVGFMGGVILGWAGISQRFIGASRRKP
ncbi:hypothetical protein GCM10023190_22630 [Enteractinococcus fodinae]|uniref:O-antigen ligase n=1 Tax=Enteractinococcus fodinae TaxID=684663 RepID=A0ABU2B2Z6_9MICC|nr:O-antigen ligase family protein [Enteractinococcus fodinae]MDR7347978.1 O-antigen ligase [Enteractinococcus fodinae]